MIAFEYARAADAGDAIRRAAGFDAKYLGGGTNLVDLMREGVERPAALIDVSGLSGEIDARADGSMLIGAAVRNTAVAADRAVHARFPVLAKAILAGASGQIRNMATVGGNILQRTRCTYFYDDAARCNKRARGTGCDAVDGFNRIHAILGSSAACVATHPSDMCVALAALDADVHLEGPGGRRVVKLVDLHRLPGDTPDIETALAPDELITAVEIPAQPFAALSTYRKARDRASYAFALVSVAAAIEVTDGTIGAARLALGGVAPKPWRSPAAEHALAGASATAETFRRAAEIALDGARPLRDNGFKIELAKRMIVATFEDLAQGARA